MSTSLLERFRGSTNEHSIGELNPEFVVGSLPGWENKERVEQSSPIRGFHSGWAFFKRLDPFDKSDYTSNSAHTLVVYQRARPLVVIDFAGRPDAGWVVQGVNTFKVERDGNMTFSGMNGKYKISDGGNHHVFEPSDGSEKKVVNLNQLHPTSS